MPRITAICHLDHGEVLDSFAEPLIVAYNGETRRFYLCEAHSSQAEAIFSKGVITYRSALQAEVKRHYRTWAKYNLDGDARTGYEAIVRWILAGMPEVPRDADAAADSPWQWC